VSEDAGTKLVRLAGVAVLFGTLAGVVYGLIRGGVWEGVTYGAVYGIGFAVLLGVTRRSTAMSKLTHRQRKQVRQALRSGEGVSDPGLASALVEEARRTLATPLTSRNAGIAAGMFFVFGVGAAVFGNAAYGVHGLVVGLFLILCSLALLVQMLSVTERSLDLVSRSLRATEEGTGE
jgi:hypothetical protein